MRFQEGFMWEESLYSGVTCVQNEQYCIFLIIFALIDKYGTNMFICNSKDETVMKNHGNILPEHKYF